MSLSLSCSEHRQLSEDLAEKLLEGYNVVRGDGTRLDRDSLRDVMWVLLEEVQDDNDPPAECYEPDDFRDIGPMGFEPR